MGALMKPVVTNMTAEDFINISAYVASRPAAAQQPTFSTASN
jgi:cytochrome c553